MQSAAIAFKSSIQCCNYLRVGSCRVGVVAAVLGLRLGEAAIAAAVAAGSGVLGCPVALPAAGAVARPATCSVCARSTAIFMASG